MFEGVVAVVGAADGVLLVGDALSSFFLVKMALNNLSWNSFAKMAACLSGFSFSFLSLSQSQVTLTLQFPVLFFREGGLNFCIGKREVLVRIRGREGERERGREGERERERERGGGISHLFLGF